MCIILEEFCGKYRQISKKQRNQYGGNEKVKIFKVLQEEIWSIITNNTRSIIANKTSKKRLNSGTSTYGSDDKNTSNITRSF